MASGNIRHHVLVQLQVDASTFASTEMGAGVLGSQEFWEAGLQLQSFLHCFTLASSAFNLQVATPGGKPIDFVDVNESNARWIQDFRMKSYANPAKLESIDGARYHALLIPNCPGAVTDLANSGYLAKILQHFSTESKPICAVGQGVAALCCATNEDKSWVFQGYSMTGPSVYELVRQPNFASLSIIVEDFVKDSGATFSASSPDAVHVVLDRHLVTGQNENSTLPAVQNLLILCNEMKEKLCLQKGWMKSQQAEDFHGYDLDETSL
ncbi:hypothetical protein Nmel_006482 [Mimus melanotis]